MRPDVLALVLTAAMLAAAPATAQEVDRWRYDGPPGDGGPLTVAYGGIDGEDTWIFLTCTEQDGAPGVEAYIAVRTEGINEGTAVTLTFYGPAWSVTIPAVVDWPGLYESVTARFGLGPEDQIQRSTFATVGAVHYRLRDDVAPEVADFSQGRADLLAFLAECEADAGAPSDDAAGALDAALQP